MLLLNSSAKKKKKRECEEMNVLHLNVLKQTIMDCCLFK